MAVSAKPFEPKNQRGSRLLMNTLVCVRRLHDRRQPVGQIADAVVQRARKFAVPRNGVGSHRSALHQRSMLIGVGQQRIHDVAGVVAIRRVHVAPIARPGVHFDFGKAARRSPRFIALPMAVGMQAPARHARWFPCWLSPAPRR